MKGIQAALIRIKGYSWIKIPYLPSIEQYIETGNPAALSKVTVFGQQGGYWGTSLADGLRPIGDWQDDDRRAVHVLAAAGFEQDLWQWVDKQIRQEKETQDFHGTVARELEIGRKQKDRLARDTMSKVHCLVAGDKPNSAGRYLLSLSDDALRHGAQAVNNERYGGALGSVAALLLQFATDRVRALAQDLLVCDHEKSVSLPVAEAMLKHDTETYAPVIAQAMKSRKDTWGCFHVAQALYAASPDRYGNLALEASRAALAGSGMDNNHGPVATFMIGTFRRQVLGDILAYFKKERQSNWDDEILEAASAAYKMDMLPVILATLDRYAKRAAELAKAKPGDYSARYQLQSVTSSRAGVVEQLMAVNDGTQDGRIQQELERGLAATDAGTVVAFLNLAGKWGVGRVIEHIWGLLEHKSKPVRETAARILARGGEAALTRAAELLAHKKGDVRMAAAYLLACANTPSALEALESRLEKEENDDVRDQMLLGLEEAWAKQGRKVSRKDVDKRIRRAADKCESPIASWVKLDALPALQWAGGGKLNKQAVSYLLYRQSRAKEIRPDVEAKAMYDLLDRETSGDFAKALLAAFVASKQDAGDRWALVVACKLGDDRLVPILSTQMRDWVDANRGKLAEYAVQALALLGTDAALLTVDAMAIRYRNKMKNVGKAATEAFEGAAEALGITPDELGDRVVPWLGFEPGKQRVIESAGGWFEVSVGMDFKLGYKDLIKNKPVKSLPKSCPVEVLAELKEISGTLREAVKAQLLRLENLLVRQRCWPVARWKQLFLAHPLLLPFAVRLVWGHFDDSGKLLGLFRGLEDRSLTTIGDETYAPGDTGHVRMVHPLEMDDVTRQAWQNHLADYEIEPPFPQLERQVVRVAETDAKKKTYTEHAGKSINAMTFKGRAERLGWHRGSVCDGGGITSYVKTFPAAGADVILGVEDFYIGIDMYSDMKLGDVMFVRSGSVTFGSYTYDEPGKEDDPRVLPFGEVPPIVFSEAMGDLEKIAGKAQEGAEQA